MSIKSDANERECIICGKSNNITRVYSNKSKFKMELCEYHYLQMQRHGKILEKTRFSRNKIIKYNDYAEIILYDIHGIEKTRTKIDLEDIKICNKHKWSLSNMGYVKTNTNINLNKFIHRLIMKCPDNMVIDHINHDTLDNRKCNLRICTQSQNCYNSLINKNNTSKIKGVYFRKDTKLWTSYIGINYKRINLGCFNNIQDAINVRNDAELKYYGEYNAI